MRRVSKKMTTAKENKALIDERAKKLVEGAGAEAEVIGPVGEMPEMIGTPISEALGESGLDAEEIVPMESALGLQIKIIGADVRDGDFGEYVIIFYDGGDGHTLGISCGGKVVVRKIKSLIDSKAFPVIATPVQIKKYYDLQ